MAFSPPDKAPCSFLVRSCQPAPFARSTLTTNWCQEGVVEDLGQLLFPARRGVVGLGLLDALTEEAMQGFAVSVAQPDRILEQEISRGLGARREVWGNLPDQPDRHLRRGAHAFQARVQVNAR